MRRRSIVSGASCSRSICRCTPTFAPSSTRSTATRCRVDGPIPAYLLGNIWAQDWSNVYDLVAPAGKRAVSIDAILKQRNTQPLDMARTAERFFTSLGFDPLPKTFYERSLFVKPRDRDVVCHASAWDIDNVDDLRIKMCIDPTEEDFITIHHELGHNFYQRAYNKLPLILRDSANDGFHEAIGDTIALSVTPEYLVKIGMLQQAPDASGDIPLLLGRALEKLSFLPFGLLIDQWRWGVFSGEVKPDAYNSAWWDLRQKYQGVSAPTMRGEQFFDPGAKYHVPNNTPYARYFLAAVLQFQFHRALAKAAGCTAPLHRCSIYGNTAAGDRLKKALAMGASRPWPDVLEVLTGQREMDATAIADYFAPLKTWLDEQNKGRKIGWQWRIGLAICSRRCETYYRRGPCGALLITSTEGHDDAFRYGSCGYPCGRSADGAARCRAARSRRCRRTPGWFQEHWVWCLTPMQARR